MDAPHIDFLAILIAALLNIIIGWVWYSPLLFGEKKPYSRGKKYGKIALHGAVVLLSAYILAIIEAYLGVTTVTDGMFVGLLIWMGFVASTQIYAVIWGKMSWKHWMIHAGCQLLALLAMGGVLGA